LKGSTILGSVMMPNDFTGLEGFSLANAAENGQTPGWEGCLSRPEFPN
jgi:hypothetical protein